MKIIAEEIRRRQLINQHLTAKTDTETAVRDLCGIQAQFMNNVYHALKIRCSDFDKETLGDGLVKSWTLRGTMHVFSEKDLPLFIRPGDGYRSQEWAGRTFWNQRESWALTPERQRVLTDVILEALADGPKSREELKEICLRHGMTEPEEDSMFDPWGGGMRQICERGFACYAATDKKVFRLLSPFSPMDEEGARLETVRRYFTHYGPATLHDAAYFLGMRQGDIKQQMAKLPLTSLECDGRIYYGMDNEKQYEGEIPDCLFLAGFDPLMLGYEKKESLYLPAEHLRGIFNLAGIVMPAVLLRGRVVGRWKYKNRALTVTLFESVGEESRLLISDTAVALWGDILKIHFD